MIIKSYCIKDLSELIQTDFFKNSPILPISSHRAISHSLNPNAQADDKILWIALEDEKLVAYRLVLPDIIYKNKESVRMAWLSCIYVHPSQRGKGYGKLLTTKALEAWDYKLMGTNFAPASRSMYKAMGLFDDFRTYNGLRAYLRMNLTFLLPKRNPKFKKIKPILKLVDWTINAFQNLRLYFYNTSLKADFSYKITRRVDEEVWGFIKKYKTSEFMRRDEISLNWLLQYPWIISSKLDENQEEKRFHFSAFAHAFEQKCVQVFYKKTLIGFLILTMREGLMQVPYVYYDKIHTAAIADVIIEIALEQGQKTLTLYNQHLVDYIKNTKQNPFILIRDFTRRFMFGKGFSRDLKGLDYIFQDGDGDAGFT